MKIRFYHLGTLTVIVLSLWKSNKLLWLLVPNILFFQIANILDSHAATLQRKADREVFFMNTQSIVQLVQRQVLICIISVRLKILFQYNLYWVIYIFHIRYRSGIRGYMKSVVLDLLKRYLEVEMQFQQGDVITYLLWHFVLCTDFQVMFKLVFSKQLTMISVLSIWESTTSLTWLQFSTTSFLMPKSPRKTSWSQCLL